jgi:topoisomerase-4 subunit A
MSKKDTDEENEENLNPEENLSDDKTDGEELESDAEAVDAVDEPPTDEDEALNIIPLSGMYEDWFLDYASYVILERAVPALFDGLKPVQRRILHSMKDLDDGRYNKVANIIGHTMKYHPHGDASIGDALVQIGQKELVVDTQGNWGNTLTGDGAAAPRYIEARLTKFALEVVFNPKTTDWQLSYDGRNKEPVFLPMKFPLLLAQGAEGIAVGLACKMLPHNFCELIDASVNVLKGKRTNILPDFLNGGMADFSQYNDGLRGGKVRLRARIRQEDKKTLIIHEVPHGTTTGLIDSIIKANDKGKIKIKKIEDNTAEFAEIVVHLPGGVSPDKMIDALYAFTDCEVSISPNACVIENDKPRFLGVNEMLKISTENTKDLLQLELEIKKRELQEQWHFASLEKIFIENRIYRDIEECETWEAVIEAIDKGIHKYISTPGRKNKGKDVLKLHRDITEDDIARLTEIKIKRISKFDAFKADEHLKKLEDGIAEVQNNLDNLTDYAIAYFKRLKEKYGKGRERKTEIRTFDNIVATKVIVSNKRLYVNREEGFIGWSLRKDEFVSECSDIDNIIVIKNDGTMMVAKIADKKFVGKDIIHVAVWKKNDKRTIYHLIYQDGSKGAAMMKRFSVTSITRDKDYFLTKGTKGSKVLYFSANPNGESEVVQVLLRPRPHLKKLRFDINFAELAIKGRGAGGNIATKNLISKVIQKEVGGSTLAARKVWFDDVVNRLNADSRGELLGEFKGEDKIITIHPSGEYKLNTFSLSNRFDEEFIVIEKFNPRKPISAIYYDGEKKGYYIKRFIPEGASVNKMYKFITEHEDSQLEMVSTDWLPRVHVEYDKRSSSKEAEEINLEEFISLKGEKALGNRLTTDRLKSIDILEPLPFEEPEPEPETLAELAEAAEQRTEETAEGANENGKSKEGPVVVELSVDETNGDKKTKKEKADPSDEEDQPQLF